ncbi:hypothetical protein Pan161_49490 [Gimesia algae]|uniref:Uncharacterized protein n=1 Tax=Gimesia algae TaxID=2527971 RepID=A0A517VJS0_9PLAN|nr:hypothetical protein Pan161_49490 [Gimesia algae]
MNIYKGLIAGLLGAHQLVIHRCNIFVDRIQDAR